MYCIKRHHTLTGELAYFKREEGWVKFSDQGPLDLTGVMLFTEGERRANTLRPSEEWQWYGAYKK